MTHTEETSWGDDLNEGIRALLQALRDDLVNGVADREAGWKKPSELGIDSGQVKDLGGLLVLESNDAGEVRIDFNNRRCRRKLATFEIQFREIDYIMENQAAIAADEKRVRIAERIAGKCEDAIGRDAGLLPSMIAIGLWKMLNISDMPAKVDDFLREGFSPRDWVHASFRAIPSLSVSLCRKIGEVGNLTDAFELTRGADLIENVPTLSDEADDVERVARVLRWDEIERSLTEDDLKLLGLSWFIVFLLEENEALPSYPDFSIEVARMIEELDERIMNANYKELAESFENRIISLEDQDVKWASMILFLPEAV